MKAGEAAAGKLVDEEFRRTTGRLRTGEWSIKAKAQKN